VVTGRPGRARVTHVLTLLVVAYEWFVLTYFVALNSTYLVLMVLALVDIVRLQRALPFAGYEEELASPLTLPVSILIPAHNEETSIVESVRAMQALRYPENEIIVIDDGSVDGTFAVLCEAFDLVDQPRLMRPVVPTIGAVLGTYAPRDGSPLLVVRKVGAGKKTDALNVGICAARLPLLCMVDADALLDEEALLRVVKPFVDDPRVIATGGVIRPANGSTVYRGRVTETRMPRRWLARIQVVEYLRAFLLGRAGWSRAGGLLIISGAFGVFRRDLVIQAGGYDHDSIGEDAELVARLHKLMRAQEREYRIEFVADPVCWTEVPESLRVLGRQRRRWARGLTDLLLTHKRMIGNPRYGLIGVVVLPYFLLFEALGPAVELTGFVVLLAGLALGLFDPQFAFLFLTVAIGYGLFLSFAALLIEDYSFRRYRGWRELSVALASAVGENVGYRQLTAWWRLRGLMSGLARRETRWGVMERKGFIPPPT
jgi:cellulose synthase/poly-beta-1,6-N-acetylglucosamine synthase-like glycosyltransferase